jgi:hypothetical protein
VGGTRVELERLLTITPLSIQAWNFSNLDLSGQQYSLYFHRDHYYEAATWYRDYHLIRPAINWAKSSFLRRDARAIGLHPTLYTSLSFSSAPFVFVLPWQCLGVPQKCTSVRRVREKETKEWPADEETGPQ